MRLKVLYTGLMTAVLSLVVLSVPMHAAPLVGELNISGDVAVYNNGPGNTVQNLDWFPIAGGNGTFNVGFSSTGDFAALGGTSGTALDLNSVGEPVGTPLTLNNFLTFSSNSNLSFELLMIEPGLTSGPFTMINTPTGVNISMSVRTLATDTGTGNSGLFNGLYTTQIPGATVAGLLAGISGGGIVTSTYSASFSSVPEPSSVYLLLSGALLVAVGTFRKRSRDLDRAR